MDKSVKIENPVKMLLNPVHFIALGFGSGLVPRIPGTTGTLVGVLLFMVSTVSWAGLGLDWYVFRSIII